MTTLAELYAAANQRNMLARRNEPLDAPFDPAHQIPQGMTPPLRMGDVANLAMQNAPGLGDVASLIESYKAWKAGDTTGGLLSGMAALPMVGAIKVYHGSPHKFDKFDMSKIGTGEGAQAYGHGLYFADSPEVGDIYRKNTSRQFDKVAYKGTPLSQVPGDEGSVASQIVSDMDAGVPFEQAKSGLLSYLEQEGSSEMAAYLRNMRPDHFSTLEHEGHLYETSLEWPDPAREAADPLGPQHFLDWNRPLSEQPNASQALKDYADINGLTYYVPEGQSSPIIAGHGISGDSLGRDALRFFGGGNDPASASDNARYFGIPGIRYLDAGSRGAGDGTYNYVVFDDQIPRIVNRK